MKPLFSYRLSLRLIWAGTLWICATSRTLAEGFTDSNWAAVGGGVNGKVYALASQGTNVFVGGAFTSAGGKSVGYVARWDGQNWFSLGSGVNAPVYALASAETNLYVGGLFTKAGSLTANHVARWDGSSWQALGQGVTGYYPYLGDGEVRALAVWRTNVYAGGLFVNAGYGSARSVAVWSGTAWSPLGAGFNGTVMALAASDAGIYAGGDFSSSGSAVVALGRYNSYNWTALGSGLGGQEYPYVSSLLFIGTNLYVGGSYGLNGTTGTRNINMWDGQKFIGMPGLRGGLSFNFPEVRALAASETTVFAGGDFSVNGVTNRVAKWDGAVWTGLGSGVNNRVRALVVCGTDLYVGGDFTIAGGKSCSYIARAYLHSLPRLQILPADSGLLISWPRTQTEGFRLEAAQGCGTNKWIEVTGQAIDDAERRGVLVGPDSAPRFYRLRRP